MLQITRVSSAFLSLLFFFIPASHGETLSEALSHSFANNPSLNSARALNDVIAEQISIESASYLPNISASGSYRFLDRTIEDRQNLRTNTSNNSYGYDLELAQNLLSGFSRKHRVTSARHQLSSNDFSLVSREQEILLSAVESYLDVLRNQDLVGIRRKNLIFLEEQTKSSEARLDVGDATRTDVSQSRAQLALARAQLSASIATTMVSRSQYRLVIGHDPEDLHWPSLLSIDSSIYLPETLESALKISLSDHPLLESALSSLSSSEADERVLKSSFLPTLSLRASRSKNYNDSGSALDESLSFGLSVPLYRGGEEYAALRAQKARITQEKYQVDQVRLRLHSFVVSAWSNLEAAEANFRANNEQLDASKLALEGVIKERDVGRRTHLDVLDAQNAVLRAEQSLLNSRVSRIVSEYQLLSSMGRLTAKNLSLH